MIHSLIVNTKVMGSKSGGGREYFATGLTRQLFFGN